MTENTPRVWIRDFQGDRGLNKFTYIVTLEGIGYKVEVHGFEKFYDTRSTFAQVRSSYFRAGKWVEVFPWSHMDSTGREDSLQAIAEGAVGTARGFLHAVSSAEGK